jgi:hypothetical protein
MQSGTRHNMSLISLRYNSHRVPRVTLMDMESCSALKIRIFQIFNILIGRFVASVLLADRRLMSR